VRVCPLFFTESLYWLGLAGGLRRGDTQPIFLAETEKDPRRDRPVFLIAEVTQAARMQSSYNALLQLGQGKGVASER
jgi:hypothetical protein